MIFWLILEFCQRGSHRFADLKDENRFWVHRIIEIFFEATNSLSSLASVLNVIIIVPLFIIDKVSILLGQRIRINICSYINIMRHNSCPTLDFRNSLELEINLNLTFFSKLRVGQRSNDYRHGCQNHWDDRLKHYHVGAVTDKLSVEFWFFENSY